MIHDEWFGINLLYQFIKKRKNPKLNKSLMIGIRYCLEI